MYHLVIMYDCWLYQQFIIIIINLDRIAASLTFYMLCCFNPGNEQWVKVIAGVQNLAIANKTC